MHTEETVFRQKIEQHLCALCAGSGDWRPPERAGDVTVISHTAHVRRGGGPPPPPEVEANGLLAVADYMARLHAVEAFSNFLLVYSDAKPLIFLDRMAGEPAILLSCVSSGKGLERGVEDYFSRHGIAPHRVPGLELPVLRYRLPAQADQAASLVIGLLAACFNVREHEPLGFRLVQRLHPSGPED